MRLTTTKLSPRCGAHFRHSGTASKTLRESLAAIAQKPHPNGYSDQVATIVKPFYFSRQDHGRLHCTPVRSAVSVAESFRPMPMQLKAIRRLKTTSRPSTSPTRTRTVAFLKAPPRILPFRETARCPGTSSSPCLRDEQCMVGLSAANAGIPIRQALAHPPSR